MSSQNNLDKIEHIVVLMMENRSFDNVLGFLYPDNPDFRGVNDSMCNPTPDNKSSFCVQKGTDMTAPYPDPNEPYEFVYRQLFNEPPIMPVPNRTDEPKMQGFVNDYNEALCAAKTAAHKPCKLPYDDESAVIMHCFSPESLPVINGLAQAYAVCDNWFCSVPTQTFPNRSFIHAATSSGNVYNSWKDEVGIPGIFINDTLTIYNKLKGKASWRIYHGGPWWLCNALYGQKKLWDLFLLDFLHSREKRHFSPLQSGDFSSDPNSSQANQFFEDVQSGNLADYTFIEPNMMCSKRHGPENDMHPAFSVHDTGDPTNVLYGEKLIYDVYNALRSNEEIWNKTLLIITFDEHGGCFDHVPPPTCESSPAVVVPPDDEPPKPYKKHTGKSGFDFQRLGVRVPAVLVSPWIEKGTICHTLFDHTSVIKTVSNKWLEKGDHLTKRDQAANDLSEILSSPTLRTDEVQITPRTPPLFEGCRDKPLSDVQSDMVLAASKLLEYHHLPKINLNELDTTEKVIDKFYSIFE